MQITAQKISAIRQIKKNCIKSYPFTLQYFHIIIAAYVMLEE